MDNLHENAQDNYLWQDSYAQDLDAWFTVSGDADDFIFYGEDSGRHSEK